MTQVQGSAIIVAKPRLISRRTIEPLLRLDAELLFHGIVHDYRTKATEAGVREPRSDSICETTPGTPETPVVRLTTRGPSGPLARRVRGLKSSTSCAPAV